MDFYVFIVLL